MSKDATVKGSLLAAGVALESIGASFLLTEKWAVGLVFIGVGVGVFFAREFFKEV